MPIYEYRCSKCSKQFEMIHGVSEKDLRIACPKCGATKPERVISTFSCGGAKGTDGGPSSGCGPTPGRFS